MGGEVASLIVRLRSVVPLRSLNRFEALRVAELQAKLLLRELGVIKPPVPEDVISSLPRIEIQRVSGIPVSGSAQWVSGRWLIVVDQGEPLVRQRFSLAHELKHILDSPFITFLYLDSAGVSSATRIEQVADYFAASLLMPRQWLRRAWASGMHSVPLLAKQFGVSYSAMRVRLLQLGLVNPPAVSQRTLFRVRKAA